MSWRLQLHTINFGELHKPGGLHQSTDAMARIRKKTLGEEEAPTEDEASSFDLKTGILLQEIIAVHKSTSMTSM